MTRKHFEMLAKSLLLARPTGELNHMDQWERDVEAIAHVCAGFNSLFDRDRFLKACGYE